VRVAFPVALRHRELFQIFLLVYLSFYFSNNFARDVFQSTPGIKRLADETNRVSPGEWQRKCKVQGA
jgi:hypothetical protein